MADIYKGELQDNLGNTVYPHTEADVVFCTDGKTAQEKLAGYENAIGNVTGTSGSLEVNDANILATTEATKKLNDSFGGLDIRYNSETGKPEWKERGADTFNPFKGEGGLKAYPSGSIITGEKYILLIAGVYSGNGSHGTFSASITPTPLKETVYCAADQIMGNMRVSCKTALYELDPNVSYVVQSVYAGYYGFV